MVRAGDPEPGGPDPVVPLRRRPPGVLRRRASEDSPERVRVRVPRGVVGALPEPRGVLPARAAHERHHRPGGADGHSVQLRERHAGGHGTRARQRAPRRAVRAAPRARRVALRRGRGLERGLRRDASEPAKGETRERRPETLRALRRPVRAGGVPALPGRVRGVARVRGGHEHARGVGVRVLDLRQPHAPGRRVPEMVRGEVRPAIPGDAKSDDTVRVVTRG
mmetsp:Transcript_10143/g.43151  ORF Transcript_10143/g.43151 Transcript_10143/m.43151 type:complete len:222 (+) Transcript_10143:140-805(+)